MSKAPTGDTPAPENSLGELILAKREREGIGLREAAAASGISFSTLSRIERGGGASLRVDRIARAWLNGETAMLPLPLMTLRDWFAGQALAGLTARIDETFYKDMAEGIRAGAPMAIVSYVLADAMLAKRAEDNT